MKKIRNLLLDCRAALRRADAGFARTPLSGQIDDTIIELGRAAEAQAVEPVEPESRTAQQVAYAWQMAARDLRYSHPDLHGKLTERVLQLLDVDVLHDPAAEIQALQSRVHEGEAKLRDAVAELSALRQVLVDAVPTLDGNMPAPEAARVRLRMLVDSAARGGGLSKPAPAVPHGSSVMLTHDALREVAAGQRTLSRDERDWCIGEAMVLSGFQCNPAQLLADGEAALARLILDAPGSG
jgi:hypothetical protein